MYFKCFNCFPLDNNPQSTTNLVIIIGVFLAIALLITIILIAVVIMLIVRYNCCVKNEGQPSSTDQTQTVINNPMFDDDYDDPALYYTENGYNYLTSPTSHGHNPVILSEDIETNITPLDTTYETIPSDVNTSSEHYDYIDRPKSDSIAVYVVVNRDKDLSEQSIQLNENVAYNSSTTQSMSSPNMGDVSLEQSISLNENVAYNNFTQQSENDYI